MLKEGYGHNNNNKHPSIFIFYVISFSLLFSNSLTSFYILSSSSSSSSSSFSTSITKPFKDHIFWSLKTRSRHYKLYFFKSSRAFIIHLQNCHHNHQRSSLLHLLLLLQGCHFTTLGSDLYSFLFVTQEA